MFETLIEKYSSEAPDFKLRTTELSELIETAMSATAHPAVWAKFRSILLDKSDLKTTKANETYAKCRITADLGCEVWGIADFVPAFLKSRGFQMDFSGSFGNATDANYILNEMNRWSQEIIGGRTIYPSKLIEGEFQNWQTRERDLIKTRAYTSVMFDPSADKSALQKFAALITADPSHARATEIALANFIYRTKNHMREVWKHSCHLMPILYGVQGSGKSTAVDLLLSPLDQMAAKVGFDILEHDSKMYQLSVTPILMFDELAGITKAEVERIKDVMLADRRELRQLYRTPSTRTLVSTFIGCTNRDVATVIKDETGNRRFYQIDTPDLIDLNALRSIDFKAIWQSVDEDGLAPLYANANDFKTIQTIQLAQRFKSEVEEWLADAEVISGDWLKSSDLFADHFMPWVHDMYPAQERFQNFVKFGKELHRLMAEQHPRLTFKNGASTKLWRVGPLVAGPDIKLISHNEPAHFQEKKQRLLARIK